MVHHSHMYHLCICRCTIQVENVTRSLNLIIVAAGWQLWKLLCPHKRQKSWALQRHIHTRKKAWKSINKAKSAYRLSAPIRDYSFDIEKSSEIFDWLLETKLIKLVGRHKIPTKAETRGRDYCKWHNAFTHQTKDCVTFRNVIQDKIERRILKFPEKLKEQMKADINPFPPLYDLNMISADFESLISSFKNDKNSKCNVYQCVNVWGKQSLHLTQGMKRLKINEGSSVSK